MTSISRYRILYVWIVTGLGRAMSIMVTAAVQLIQPASATHRRHSNVKKVRNVVPSEKSMDALARETTILLENPLPRARLLETSRSLQEEYRAKLQSSPLSMLPSYQHTLPTGREGGDFLALDVGGSTFRIALIRLQDGREEVRRIRSFMIDNRIRALEGQAFFDWMAERMADMLEEYNRIHGTTDARLNVGLAWSFPIEQTSPRSGRLQPMGKGFSATYGVEGEDLSELLMRSCRAKRLNVDVRAIVNDSQATLLSQAYRDPATRMSLILGTGTNAAVFLPISALGPHKFGHRPDSWYSAAQHVLVNTELSMFGKHVLPSTRWDDELNAAHTLPDFQPLEYMITGRYLGEIVRLILVEAIATAGLFHGCVPRHLYEPYALDTRILAAFQSDDDPKLSRAREAFATAHPCPRRLRTSELAFIRQISMLVSRRAAFYLAIALHALWSVRTEAEGLETTDEQSEVTIACDGTIVEKYPGFREGCQAHLDDLCGLSGARKGAVTLRLAPESSILGAAVATCCLGDT